MAPHFVKSPIRLPAYPKGLFYMEIFPFSIFNLCNEALTSFAFLTRRLPIMPRTGRTEYHAASSDEEL